MIDNTTKVDIFTNLAGHTQWGDEEAFKDNIGYWVNEQVNCLLPQKKEDRSQLEIPFNNPQKGYQEKSPAPKVETCDTPIHPFAQKFFDDNYDEEITREKFYELLYYEMKERFFDYYQNDPKEKLGGFISDYGLDPLLKLQSELLRSTTPEEKLLIIDRMLNVVHQRSDIAEWFVEGGSKALSQLSSSPSEAINENSRIFISKSHTMKKTLQEEKERVFEIMRKLTNESIGLSILGGMHNMSIEHIKEIRNTVASGLSDKDFKELIMNAVNVVLSDTGKNDDVETDYPVSPESGQDDYEAGRRDDYYDTREKDKDLGEQMGTPNNGGEMEIDDHVYCPLRVFKISAHPSGEGKYDKDSIDFTVKGDSNMGNLKIVNVDAVGDYTDEEIEQAKQLVEKAIRTSNIPSGVSFNLSNSKNGNMEF